MAKRKHTEDGTSATEEAAAETKSSEGEVKGQTRERLA